MNSSRTGRLAFGIIAIVSMVLLSGCYKTMPTGWTYSRSPVEQSVRQAEWSLLTSMGIQIFVQGESVKIILPDALLFEVYSANLRYSARFLLDHVATFIKTYTIEGLQVSAYSDSEAWPGAPDNQKQALTNRQAEVIASYLWANNMDMRFVTAKGYNEMQAVAWNDTPLGRSFNRRVEITFRFYPNFNPYN